MNIMIKRLALSLAPLLLFGPLTQAWAQTCPEIPKEQSGLVDRADGWEASKSEISDEDLQSLSFGSVMLLSDDKQSVVLCGYVFNDPNKTAQENLEANKKGFTLEDRTNNAIKPTGNSWAQTSEDDETPVCEESIKACTFEMQ